MRLPFIGVAYTLTLLAAFPGAAQQAKGGSDDFGPYDVVENWLKPVKPGFLEKGVAVFAESPDRIYVTTSVEFAVPVRGRSRSDASAGAQGESSGCGPRRERAGRLDAMGRPDGHAALRDPKSLRSHQGRLGRLAPNRSGLQVLE